MLNRFDQPLAFQAKIKHYAPTLHTPDFTAIGKAIQVQQNKYNAGEQLSQLTPDAREIHQKEARAYKARQQERFASIAEIYKSQGMNAGNRALKSMTRDLKDQVSDPNSEYNKFKQLKDSYKANSEMILKEFKDTPGAANNKQYALDKLEQKHNKSFASFYDIEAQKSIASPSSSDEDIVSYVDVGKDMVEKLKHMEASEIQKILPSDISSYYLKHQSFEGLSPERVRVATQALLKDPKYSQQLFVDRYAAGKNITPEQAKKFYKDNADRAINAQEKAISSALSSKNKQEIAALQRQLNSEGYNLTVDGMAGKQTKAAVKKYRQELSRRRAESDNMTEQQAHNAYTRDAVEGNYIDGMQKVFSSDKYKEKLIFRQDLAHLDNIKRKDEELKIMRLGMQQDIGGLSSFNAGSITLPTGKELEQKYSDNIASARDMYYSNIMQKDSEFNKIMSGRGGPEQYQAPDGSNVQENPVPLSADQILSIAGIKDNAKRLDKMKGLGMSRGQMNMFNKTYNGQGDISDALHSAGSAFASAKYEKEKLMEAKYTDAKRNIKGNDKLMALVNKYAKEEDIHVEEAMERFIDGRAVSSSVIDNGGTVSPKRLGQGKRTTVAGRRIAVEGRRNTSAKVRNTSVKVSNSDQKSWDALLRKEGLNKDDFSAYQGVGGTQAIRGVQGFGPMQGIVSQVTDMFEKAILPTRDGQEPEFIAVNGNGTSTRVSAAELSKNKKAKQLESIISEDRNGPTLVKRYEYEGKIYSAVYSVGKDAGAQAARVAANNAVQASENGAGPLTDAQYIDNANRVSGFLGRGRPVNDFINQVGKAGSTNTGYITDTEGNSVKVVMTYANNQRDMHGNRVQEPKLYQLNHNTAFVPTVSGRGNNLGHTYAMMQKDSKGNWVVIADQTNLSKEDIRAHDSKQLLYDVSSGQYFNQPDYSNTQFRND